MDFKGQQRSEKLAIKLIIYSSIIAFITGYVRQNFNELLVVFATGVAVTFMVTVPNWPMYNRDPIAWVPSKKKANKKEKDRAGLFTRLMGVFS
jgi:signal peptidase complex subunit 1